MLEPWDELLNLRLEHESCVAELETIKTTCARNHGKQHVAHCTECWNLYLNRMRDRYLHSGRMEWFTGRRQFLQELDMMFSKARGRALDFETIEQRIYDEKEDWYRDRARTLGLPAAARSPSEARLLHRKLADAADLPAAELAVQLRGLLTDDAPPDQPALDRFLAQLRDARSSPQARAEAYVEAFFRPPAQEEPQGAGAGEDAYKKYVEMIRGGSPIADVVGAMLRDRQAAQDERKRRQGLQQKLEELRRAKAAHELSLSKKQKARQDRAAKAAEAAAAAAAASPDARREVPPCSACSGRLDEQDFLACPLCQLLRERYGLDCDLALYCSRQCHDDDYVCAPISTSTSTSLCPLFLLLQSYACRHFTLHVCTMITHSSSVFLSHLTNVKSDC